MTTQARTPYVPRPRRPIVAPCESCGTQPQTTTVAMPAMPDYAMPAATFALCDDCAEFASHLLEHADAEGVTL